VLFCTVYVCIFYSLVCGDSEMMIALHLLYCYGLTFCNVFCCRAALYNKVDIMRFLHKEVRMHWLNLNIVKLVILKHYIIF